MVEGITHSRVKSQGAPAPLKQAFDAKYGSRNIRLPNEHLQDRVSASVHSDQWTVHYAFNRDLRGEYLAVLEDHPLAFASLLRINADGTIEALAHEPQFRFRGEAREDFRERCQEFNHLITRQGLPANWR